MTYLLEEVFIEDCLIAEESVETSHTCVTYTLHVRWNSSRLGMMNKRTLESAVLAKTTDQSWLGWIGTRHGSLHSDTQQVGKWVSVHQVSLVDKELGKVIAQVQT